MTGIEPELWVDGASSGAAVDNQLHPIDLRTWANLLMDEGEQLGAPPLGDIPTMSGRTLRNLWPGSRTDEEICRNVLGRIDQLSVHLATAQGEQEDKGAQALLVNIQQELGRHVHALSGR